MSLKNLGVNSGPLVHTLFALFTLYAEDYVAGFFTSDIFSTTGVESQGGQLLSIFLHSN